MDTTTDGGQRPFNVVSTHGDTFLGGIDFDREIAQMALEQFGRCSPEFEPFFNATGKGEKGVSMVKGKLQVLRQLAPEAKESHLSKRNKAAIIQNKLGDIF